MTRDQVVVPIATDMDVAALREFDSVSFQTVAAQPRGLVQTLSPEEYVAAHYANPEAGFYALCGKLSAEEENERLLEIVQVFEVSPIDVDAAGRERSKLRPLLVLGGRPHAAAGSRTIRR